MDITPTFSPAPALIGLCAFQGLHKMLQPLSTQICTLQIIRSASVLWMSPGPDM